MVETQMVRETFFSNKTSSQELSDHWMTAAWAGSTQARKRAGILSVSPLSSHAAEPRTHRPGPVVWPCERHRDSWFCLSALARAYCAYWEYGPAYIEV